MLYWKRKNVMKYQIISHQMFWPVKWAHLATDVPATSNLNAIGLRSQSESEKTTGDGNK
jgi:hypothetical protein